MKKHITFFLIALCSDLYAGSMPMPSQYHNLDQYQQALQIWENVQMAQTFIPFSPMPTPNQYRNQDQYQQAIKIWERVGSSYRAKKLNVIGEIVRLPLMPIPFYYKKHEHYQQALRAYVNVSKNIIAQYAHIQPPPMPTPIQYRQLEDYQNALKVWKRIFE